MIAAGQVCAIVLLVMGMMGLGSEIRKAISCGGAVNIAGAVITVLQFLISIISYILFSNMKTVD